MDLDPFFFYWFYSSHVVFMYLYLQHQLTSLDLQLKSWTGVSHRG